MMLFSTIRATYHNGVFIPQTSCSLPDNSEVELKINAYCSPSIETIIDAQARKEILQTLLQRMRQTTLMAYTTRPCQYRERSENLAINSLDKGTKI